MLELKHVSHQFDQKLVLNNIHVTLAEQRIGILGSNGSGKSTLARLLNGLIKPSQGDVLVNGLHTIKDIKQLRRHVGFVFQNPDNQIVMPTVIEDLCFGMKNLGFSKSQIQETSQHYLQTYHLWDQRDEPAYHLSGGQKQLLAILGVLVMEPKVIIFDEPTTLLDLKNQLKIKNLIQRLEQQVVVVTHDLDLVTEFDRVLVVHEGQIAIDDSPTSAIARYRQMMHDD